MKIVFRLASLISLCLSSAAAGAASIAVQVQDAAGRPLPDVVLYAEAELGAAGVKNPKPAEIEQRGLKFLPLVSVIQTGAQISFPNNDKVRHHIYSFSPAKKFDQKLYSGVAAAPQTFDKAGTVVLGCNIHDRMIAYVKVVDTPFFAKSDAAGSARIELPAPGRYTLRAWHFNLAAGANAEQVVTVRSGDAPAAAGFRLILKAPAGDDAAQPGA